jgi:hypothetical protein
VLIYVGVPVLDGRPYAPMVDSLLAEQLLGHDKGVHLIVDWEIGCSLIGVARNRIAKRFLALQQAACLVFVDADISWTGGRLAALAQRPEPVIGGTYRAKREEVRFHVYGAAQPRDDLYLVDGLPGGFLKIDRSVFGAVKADAYLEDDGSETKDYFPSGFHDGRFYGEDYGFCRLWREAGGDVWLDPSIRLRHHDGLMAYAGDPRVWLESRA